MQQKTLDQIFHSFKDKEVTLLHGVTSSGKTEIYIHLIQEVIQKGRQVLYLVPEIALTTQLTTRLQRVFGDSLAIYHSKFTDMEQSPKGQRNTSHSRSAILDIFAFQRLRTGYCR